MNLLDGELRQIRAGPPDTNHVLRCRPSPRVTQKGARILRVGWVLVIGFTTVMKHDHVYDANHIRASQTGRYGAVAADDIVPGKLQESCYRAVNVLGRFSTIRPFQP